MKSTIKIFAVFAMVVGFAVGAKAQVSQAVTAHAKVMDALIFSDVHNVEFSNVQRGLAGGVYLNPNVLASSTNVNSLASLGSFTIDGSTSANIKISWASSIALALTGTPATTLNYYPKVVGSSDGSAQATANVATSGATFITNSSEGKYYLWIGGYLGNATGMISSSQDPGEYTGSLTFSVEYN